MLLSRDREVMLSEISKILEVCKSLVSKLSSQDVDVSVQRRALASGQSQAYKAGEHLATRSLLNHNSMSLQWTMDTELHFKKPITF